MGRAPTCVPLTSNIVATVNLDCRLNLKTIALHARNAEYKSQGCPSNCLYRWTAFRKYAHIVQKLGFDAKFSEFRIQKIVGSCDVKFPIRLEGLAYLHGQFSSYESEVREEIYTAFNTIYTVLCEFRKL
ncbi:hypothetical protein CPB85DRAFT_1373249 [Mucidula mucida]|nr:hypothetical protein CPB85DRAFT_1373249 [Mucidula mucida]